MLPHYKVFTRLGVSKIHGIGVFAISDIPKGARLFEYDNTEIVWIAAVELQNLPMKVRQLYDDFCVIKANGTLYGCPANFNQLTMAWYMNHSNEPNVEADIEYNFTTKRLIREGEELTLDYRSFGEYTL